MTTKMPQILGHARCLMKESALHMMMMTSPSFNNNNYTQQYADEQIKTASKEQLLLMLFDGAIKFLRIAKKAMIAKDYEKSNNNKSSFVFLFVSKVNIVS